MKLFGKQVRFGNPEQVDVVNSSTNYKDRESQLLRVQMAAIEEADRQKEIDAFIAKINSRKIRTFADVSNQVILDKIILSEHNKSRNQQGYGWWKHITSLTRQSLKLVFYAIQSQPISSDIRDVLCVDFRMISNDGDYSEFIEFCQTSDLPMLRNLDSMYLVSSGAPFSTKINVERNLDKLFIRLAGLSFVDKVGFIVTIFSRYVYIFYCILLDPRLSSIAHELLTMVCFSSIKNRITIKSITLSNSFIRNIPIWVSALSGTWKTSVAWYSESSVPYQFTNGIKLREEKHLAYVSSINAHYLWTDEFSDYSRKVLLRSSNFIAKGPILFRPKLISNGAKDIDILVFNTSPFSWEELNDRCDVYDYNNEINCVKFLSDIVGQAKLMHKFPRIIFKSARRIIPILSNAYFEYLEGLKESKLVEEVHFFSNMYSLVSRAKCVIVMPFSSPALVAQSLNVPVVYYDPMNLLVKSSSKSRIPLISSKRDLREFFTSIIEFE